VREIAHRIVGRALRQQRRDDVRGDTRDDQRVAVGRGLGGEIGADRAARAGAVLDDEARLQTLRELLRDEAAERVGGAARRERRDDPDGPVGPGMSMGCKKDEQTNDKATHPRIL
jgi:hypothetical protein